MRVRGSDPQSRSSRTRREEKCVVGSILDRRGGRADGRNGDGGGGGEGEGRRSRHGGSDEEKFVNGGETQRDERGRERERRDETRRDEN